MEYNVSQLMKERVGSTRTFEITAELDCGEGEPRASCRGKVAMMRTDKGIWVDAGVDVRLASACCRCLKTYERRQRLSIGEEYYPTIDVATGGRLALPDGADASSLTITSRHILDLSEGLRQALIAAEPMKPLCSSYCMGICQGCGVDMNENECRCEDMAQDSRWGPLLGLLEQISEPRPT